MIRNMNISSKGEVHYSYFPKIYPALFRFIGFMAATICVFLYSTDSYAGSALFGLIKASPKNVILIKWAVTFTCACFAAKALYHCSIAFTPTRYVSMGQSSLKIPASVFNDETVVIPFKRIQTVTSKRDEMGRYLAIQHTEGVSKVRNTFFESDDAFSDFFRQLKGSAQFARIL